MKLIKKVRRIQVFIIIASLFGLSGCGRTSKIENSNGAYIFEKKEDKKKLHGMVLARQMQKRITDKLIPRAFDGRYITHQVQAIADDELRGQSFEALQETLEEAHRLKLTYLVNATAHVMVNIYPSLAQHMIKDQSENVPLELLRYVKKHIMLKEAGVHKECSIADWIAENTYEKIVCTDEYKGCGIKLQGKDITSLYGIKHLDGIKHCDAIIDASMVSSLNLRTNHILDHEYDPDFPQKPFEQFTQLRDLWLDENLLTSIPSDMFAGLDNLSELYLCYNKLTNLPENTFHGLTHLSHLEMSHNQLTNLPVTIFQGLAHLLWLGLNFNQLTSLQKDIFSGLNNLFLLEIADNHLIHLPATIFHDLIELKHLDLAHNHLTILPEDIFQKLIQLKRLDLNNNQLTQVPKAILQGLSKFESLRLGGNLLNEDQKKEIYDFCASECEIVL